MSECLIPLTKGQFARVSPEDFESLSVHKWSALWDKNTSSFYAYRQVWIDGRNINVVMHKVILNVPTGMQVDHRYGDTLDNRRTMLRVATPEQNRWNSKKPCDNTSGYKGVRSSGKKWTASIVCRGVRIHLGTFDTPELAHEAYVHAAENLFEEFARAA